MDKSPQSFKMLLSVQPGLALTEQAKDISVLMGLESGSLQRFCRAYCEICWCSRVKTVLYLENRLNDQSQ